MIGPAERRGGGAVRYALPLTVLLLMTGVVFAVNPGHYGPFGTAIGAGMAALGGVLTVRLFRAAGAGGPESDEDDRPEDDRPEDNRPQGDQSVDTE